MDEKKVTGWDTAGVTSAGMLSDGRVRREFTGTDGSKRNIFVPADSIGHEFLLLQGILAAAKNLGFGETVTGSLMKVAKVHVGATGDRKEAAIVFQTIDNLEIRLLLDGNTAQSLAEGLAGALGDMPKHTGTLN